MDQWGRRPLHAGIRLWPPRRLPGTDDSGGRRGDGERDGERDGGRETVGETVRETAGETLGERRRERRRETAGGIAETAGEAV